MRNVREKRELMGSRKLLNKVLATSPSTQANASSPADLHTRSIDQGQQPTPPSRPATDPSLTAGVEQTSDHSDPISTPRTKLPRQQGKTRRNPYRPATVEPAVTSTPTPQDSQDLSPSQPAHTGGRQTRTKKSHAKKEK